MVNIITYVISVFILIGIGFVALNIISLVGLFFPNYSYKKMFKRMLKVINEFSLQFAFITALAAMLGSLFYSEIAGYYPCPLCWYQRIAMYPLAVVLGVALWKSDYGVYKYLIPISAIGYYFLHIIMPIDRSLLLFAKTDNVEITASLHRELQFLNIIS